MVEIRSKKLIIVFFFLLLLVVFLSLNYSIVQVISFLHVIQIMTVLAALCIKLPGTKKAFEKRKLMHLQEQRRR